MRINFLNKAQYYKIKETISNFLSFLIEKIKKIANSTFSFIKKIFLFSKKNQTLEKPVEGSSFDNPILNREKAAALIQKAFRRHQTQIQAHKLINERRFEELDETRPNPDLKIRLEQELQYLQEQKRKLTVYLNQIIQNGKEEALDNDYDYDICENSLLNELSLIERAIDQKTESLNQIELKEYSDYYEANQSAAILNETSSLKTEEAADEETLFELSDDDTSSTDNESITEYSEVPELS